ncbi:MAG: Gfo/Idh/MocA family oxidoreductase [Thermoguttaceae bacterium]|nr:Gfo/Idh/MocA family oxidoreductase [Thermoguttaceae bacterium]
MTHRNYTRREALKLASLSLGSSALLATGFPSPSIGQEGGVLSKINIAHVGIARQGAFSLEGCSGENQIALCDVNKSYLEREKERRPNAKLYQDFRVMLDEMGEQLDAIVVATPDHTHAVVAIAGMKRGLHCYSEKPLGHDLYQIRQMRKTALEKNLVTQMGTQIHALDNYRRVVELVQSGAIGKVTDVKVWCQNRYIAAPKPTEPVQCPADLDWDLWLGPAAERPYDPRLCPGTWRSFWDFGNGAMGDMACHYLDLPYWALGLDKTDPISVETTSPNPVDAETCGYDLTAKYVFAPLKEGDEPLTLSWQDGQARPECLKEFELERFGAGVLFFGTDGILFSNYDEHALLPKSKFEGFTPPPRTIPKSLGHHAEWIDAIKRGKGASETSTTCRFEYSGKIAETVLLGCFAYRCGKKLEYDAATMKATNCPEADKYFKQYSRPGWEV